jgi:hypothetical protein
MIYISGTCFCDVDKRFDDKNPTEFCSFFLSVANKTADGMELSTL